VLRMSHGLGSVQREILERLKRARAPITTTALVDEVFGKGTAAAKTSARRALANLKQRGLVHGYPGRPRRWLLVRASKQKGARRHGLVGQLDLFKTKTPVRPRS
jgi:hypothetical protein